MMVNHQGTITINTNRLLLRPFKEEDLDEFHKQITSSRKVLQYFQCPYCSNKEKSSKILTGILNDYSKYTYNWAIIDNQTNKFIGIIRDFKDNVSDEFIDLGYAIGQEYWNQGIMSEALSAVISYFSKIGFKNIYAEVIEQNIYSQKLLVKNNFKVIDDKFTIEWNQHTYYVQKYNLKILD